MAKPIKETPILKEADAKLFIENMIASESASVDLPSRERIKANYEKLNAMMYKETLKRC